jgi:glycosyltransferase involved in cell wall biosynthesis
MRTVVTISVLNEEQNIGQVLERIPSNIDVIIVDDGSTDKSVEVARRYGARVVQHCVNLGQGVGVITGFRAALMGNYAVIIEMDGDGQHDPQDISKFLDKLKETGADIVVGSRILGSNYKGAPFFRRTFLPHFTWIINRITGYHMTDAMCGFRAFRVDSLRRVQHVFAQVDEPQYLAAEMFIRFAREGLTVAEIPIHLEARNFGVSYKGLARYGWGVTRAILKTVLFSDSEDGQS